MVILNQKVWIKSDFGSRNSGIRLPRHNAAPEKWEPAPFFGPSRQGIFPLFFVTALVKTSKNIAWKHPILIAHDGNY